MLDTYTPLIPDSEDPSKARKGIFESTEGRWSELFCEGLGVLKEMQATQAEIERIERDEADVLPRGGRSRSAIVEQIEAEMRLLMPDEIDGRKLSNEESRKAWLTTALKDDPNYLAAKQRQLEIEEQLAGLRHKLEIDELKFGFIKVALSHQDAVLGFFPLKVTKVAA